VAAADGESQLAQAGRILDAVGVVDLAGRPELSGGQKLAAGGQHTDGERLVHRHFGITLPGQHTEVGRREHRARFGDQRSGGDVLAPEDYVRVVGKFGVDAHGLFPAVGLLLHQDAVGPGRQRRTGHDAGRAAGRQLCRGGIPGIELHHHRQGFGGHFPGPGGVGAVQRVAIQRAPVKGGLVHPGAERRSGDPSAGLVQPDILDRRPGQCRRGIQHTAQCLGRRTKRLFHRKISSILSRRELPSAMARTACPSAGSIVFKRQVKNAGTS